MNVTVVIPTFNRYSRIKETLSSIDEQDYRGFEVIVVDDGSTLPEYSALEKDCSGFSFPCRVIRQRNAGASAATNRGVEEAKDGLVILFDDDILPSKNCISQHVAFHRQHTSAILSGSADTDPARTETDVQQYKLHMEKIWRSLRPDTERLLRVDFKNFIITTANMSVSKAVFQSLGGFDVSLRDGYDVDFGFRALMKDVQLYFDRNIQTIHNDLISLRYYAGRQRAYTESKRRIFLQHPELVKKFGQHPEVKPTGLKRLAYSILRMPVMVSLFESAIFRWMLPRAMRYKIYGSTIASLSQSR